uniref:Uncharacterized protein n=1 Tax=Trichuris muris TaxID=70415 RepID=A0A5S6Q8W0_TRIMR
MITCRRRFLLASPKKGNPSQAPRSSQAEPIPARVREGILVRTFGMPPFDLRKGDQRQLFACRIAAPRVSATRRLVAAVGCDFGERRAATMPGCCFSPRYIRSKRRRASVGANERARRFLT